MTVNYRQGNHSPVNIWMDATYRDGDKPQSTHVGMTTNESWARAVCGALNEQYQREIGGLGPNLTTRERGIAGLQAFLHELDMGTDLSDLDPELVKRLRRWLNSQKITR